MANKNPAELRISSTVLQDLIDESKMLKIIADRGNYVSSLTKVSLFGTHDNVILGCKRIVKSQ